MKVVFTVLSIALLMSSNVHAQSDLAFQYSLNEEKVNCICGQLSARPWISEEETYLAKNLCNLTESPKETPSPKIEAEPAGHIAVTSNQPKRLLTMYIEERIALIDDHQGAMYVPSKLSEGGISIGRVQGKNTTFGKSSRSIGSQKKGSEIQVKSPAPEFKYRDFQMGGEIKPSLPAIQLPDENLEDAIIKPEVKPETIEEKKQEPVEQPEEKDFDQKIEDKLKEILLGCSV